MSKQQTKKHVSKKGKQPLVLERKFTSFGEPIDFIDNKEQELQQAKRQEEHFINATVRQLSQEGALLTKPFYIMDVNVYCKVDEEYLIGEVTLQQFTLKGGLGTFYHEVINPGDIPLGYARDVIQGSRELGLQTPDELPPTSFPSVLARICDYLASGRQGSKLPPLYTMPEKVAPVYNFLQQLCYAAGEDARQFIVYKLDTLLYALLAPEINCLTHDDFPKKSLATVLLRKDQFRYNKGLGCGMHEGGERADACSTSRARRWSYTVLDVVCPRVQLPITEHHLPPDYDVQSVVSYRQQQAARDEQSGGRDSGAAPAPHKAAAPAHVPAPAPASAWGARIPHANDAATTAGAFPPLPRRQTNYSTLVSSPAHAPAVASEEQFPRLGGPGRGGRRRK